jgi:hypothetical protein
MRRVRELRRDPERSEPVPVTRHAVESWPESRDQRCVDLAGDELLRVGAGDLELVAIAHRGHASNSGFSVRSARARSTFLP